MYLTAVDEHRIDETEFKALIGKAVLYENGVEEFDADAILIDRMEDNVDGILVDGILVGGILVDADGILVDVDEILVDGTLVDADGILVDVDGVVGNAGKVGNVKLGNVKAGNVKPGIVKLGNVKPGSVRPWVDELRFDGAIVVASPMQLVELDKGTGI